MTTQAMGVIAAARISEMEAVIRVLGVEPWTHAEIEAYKAAELAKQRQPLIYSLLSRMPLPWRVAALAANVAAVIVSFRGTLFGLYELSFVTILMAIVGCFFSLLALALTGFSYLNRTRWITVTFAKYRASGRTIPYRAILVAEMLERNILGTLIAVSYLGGDPVMYVVKGNERICLLVWDEAGRLVEPPH